MGRSLFQLEDVFIDSVCYGFSDQEVLERFADAFEDGRLVMQESVRARMRAAEHLEEYVDETTVQLIGNHFVVVLPPDAEEEILGYEYGGGEDRPMPVLRPGVQEARWPTEKAITRGLDMP